MPREVGLSKSIDTAQHAGYHATLHTENFSQLPSTI